ncbi:MAG: PEPxxWA-CTERM sorting domain-containing protein [Sphingomonadaceae bacterium]|nr:PEPxxWA-CTERM sorting domain-containing protein [Sphingomonadaceae bacterium]
MPRVLIAATLAVAAAPALAAPQPDQIVVFGDSLVDAGNVYLATGGATPSAAQGYFAGRFTNGPDYTDLLNPRLFGHLSTAALAGGNNYAFGGASIVTSNYAVPNLTTQLGLYAAGSALFGLTPKTVDPKALYVINLGGNDVFAEDSGTIPAASIPAYDATAAATLAGAVQTLANLGATRVLVTGVPVADANGLALDAAVQSALNGLTLPNTALYRFSYLNFFAALAADPAKFGVAPFTHLPSDGCFSHLAPPATADCSGYFSVDGTHPIAPIQAAIFREVAHDTGIGTVPEPAAWALMVAGFGLIGTAVRRRAAVVAA